MNYFEVDFERNEGSSFGDPFEICIRGTREPSVEEAAWFLRETASKKNAHVIDVFPLTEEEAREQFCFDDEDEWPVFDPLPPVMMQVHIKYQEGYIPPRCRKTRYETKEETISLPLAHAKMDQMVPAFELTGNGHIGKQWFGKTIYMYNDDLYREIRDPEALYCNHANSSISDLNPYQTLAWTLMNSSKFFGLRVGQTRFRMAKEATAYLNEYLVVDGTRLFVREREPFYQVCTFGLGNNHGGTALLVSYRTPIIEEYETCFNALEADAAIAKADAVAADRGDTNYVGKASADIKVLLPEAVRWNFRRELRAKVDDVKVYPSSPGAEIPRNPSLSKLPAFIWDDMYVMTPCANAFNDQVSYWVSRKGYTTARYAFSISRLMDLKDLGLPMTPDEPVSDHGKHTLKEFENLFNSTFCD